MAVHCRAGLGRTGTLIGLYMMHEFEVDFRTALAWLRMCRPGSVVGEQQQFLQKMEHDLGKVMMGKEKWLKSDLKEINEEEVE